MSLYFGLEHPEIFRQANGDVAISLVGERRDFAGSFAKFATTSDRRSGLMWAHRKIRGLRFASTQVRRLRDALIEKGWALGDELAFMEDEGAGHNEWAWGHRAPRALKFLFPPVGG